MFRNRGKGGCGGPVTRFDGGTHNLVVKERTDILRFIYVQGKMPSKSALSGLH